jgi:hypothetical protein
METVFSMWFVPRCYKQDSFKQRVSTIGNLPRRTPVSDLHMAFKIPYVYDYITKLCRQQAKSYKIMIMRMFALLDKAKPDIEA